MRKLLTATLAVLLLVAGAASAANGQAAKSVMQKLNSPAGRFSIQFPGAPSSQSQQVAINGDTATLYMWSVETDNGNVSYMISYFDFPASYNTGSPNDLLIRIRNNAIQGKTAGYDAPLTLNGIPGRVYDCTGPDGVYYDAHIFFINNRLYQLTVGEQPGHPAANLNDFFGSLTINP